MFATVFLLGCLFRIGRTLAVPSPARKSLNIDPQWTKWPASKIPFYIDDAYTPDQAKQIRAAAQKVSSDMSGCITFVETSRTSPEYKIHVTPNRDGSGGKEARCFSYPGIFVPHKKSGAKKQRLVLTEGPQGCFDGTLHSLMKYFTIMLGKINEHQRPDRDEYLTVNHANMVPNSVNIFIAHDVAVSMSACPYDYCSITHNQPDGPYVKKGAEGFIVKNKPFYIPKLGRLSECDCKDLSAIYEGCDAAKCEPLNCADLDDAGDDADAV